MKRVHGCPDTSLVMYNIAVVGGGPGGLHAAYLLARSGFKVILFEEHASAGDPVHCTGVLAVEAFDEFDLPRSAFLNSLTTVQFFGPSGASIEYSTRRSKPSSSTERPSTWRSANVRNEPESPYRSGNGSLTFA